MTVNPLFLNFCIKKARKFVNVSEFSLRYFIPLTDLQIGLTCGTLGSISKTYNLLSVTHLCNVVYYVVEITPLFSPGKNYIQSNLSVRISRILLNFAHIICETVETSVSHRINRVVMTTDLTNANCWQ